VHLHEHSRKHKPKVELVLHAQPQLLASQAMVRVL
jgi:hypothetical protein